MKTEVIKEIITDRVVILNTSTFMLALSQVDMIIKMVFYSVSILYTLWMLYLKIKEVQVDKCDDGLDNQARNNQP